MKPLHTRLKDINTQELYIETLIKFLKTKKGQEMVQLVDTMSADSLMTKFNAPKPSKRMAKTLGATQRGNMLKAAMKAVGIRVTVKRTGMPNYSEVLYAKQKNGELKLAPSLTKDEQKRLNKRDQWVIKRDKLGNPIIKTEKFIREGELAPRMLFDATSGKPIYKYTPKPNPKGIAWKCNAYAKHKIAKWERRHPKPTESELKMDLFPHDLMTAWRARRNIAVEAIRNAVASKYYRVPDPTKELHLCHVGITHCDNGTDVVWEDECSETSYGCPLSGPVNSLMTMKQRLVTALNNHGSSQIVKLKVYNRHGDLQCEVDRDTPRLSIAA